MFEILIYTKSALEELHLEGNILRNEGTCRVLQGVSIAKSLKKIYLEWNAFLIKINEENRRRKLEITDGWVTTQNSKTKRGESDTLRESLQRVLQ